MIKASTVAAKSASKWQLREQWEQGWNIMREESSTDETVRTKQVAYLSAWLDMELSLPETSTKQKFKGREQEQSKLDPRCVVMAYERLLSVLCYWREQAGRASEAAVWLAYHRFMTRTNGISKAEATRVLQRGVRCCPGSGDLWSTWLAHHVRAVLEDRECEHKLIVFEYVIRNRLARISPSFLNYTKTRYFKGN